MNIIAYAQVENNTFNDVESLRYCNFTNNVANNVNITGTGIFINNTVNSLNIIKETFYKKWVDEYIINN